MPEPNADLLRRTLAYIEAHPEEHDQEIWICGTAACFAGRAVLLDGGVPYPGNRALVEARPDDDRDCVFDMLPIDDDEYITVRDRAQRILGLDAQQTSDLFDANNTLDDLRRIVAELTAGGAS